MSGQREVSSISRTDQGTQKTPLRGRNPERGRSATGRRRQPTRTKIPGGVDGTRCVGSGLGDPAAWGGHARSWVRVGWWDPRMMSEDQREFAYSAPVTDQEWRRDAETVADAAM